MVTTNKTTTQLAWLEKVQQMAGFQCPQSENTAAAIAENELAEKVQHALDNPVYFPALNESVFAGDSVAIVLQTDLPQPLEILAAMLRHLRQSNIEPTDVRVIVSPSLAAAFGIEHKPHVEPEETDGVAANSAGKVRVYHVEGLGDDFHAIEFEVHDPSFEEAVACIAMNADSEPIHVNRTMADADVVIPIGCSWPTSESKPLVTDCVYPEFSSAETAERFDSRSGSLAHREQEVMDANNNLGVFFGLHTTAAPGGMVNAIRFGNRKDVLKETSELANEVWALPEDSVTGGMVIGTIESEPATQTWDDFRDALIHANRYSTSETPIVIWSQIGMKPDRNTRKACQAQFSDKGVGKLTKDFQSLASIVCERPIFLHCNLPRATVEELGLGYLKTEEDLDRLLQNHPVGSLIRDVHRVRVV